MLTLRELRNMVEVAEVKGRVPSVKALLESDIPIAVKETLGEQAEISVYQNGLVLYRVGKRATVFPLHNCTEYIYESGEKIFANINERFFDNENWYIRLILEGEDRLAKNQEVRNGKKTISYSAVAEDWDVLGEEDTTLAGMILCETMEEALLPLTENQRYVLKRHYLDGITQRIIAKKLGVSNQAVSDMIRKAIRKVQKVYGEGSQSEKTVKDEGRTD